MLVDDLKCAPSQGQEDLSKDLFLFLRIFEDPNKGLCEDFNENWRIFISTDVGNIVAHAEFHLCFLIKIPLVID